MGTASAQHRITLTPPVPFVTEPERVPNPAYDKKLFASKLQGKRVCQNEFSQRVLDQLPEAFILDDLHHVLTVKRRQTDPADATTDRAARGILLAGRVELRSALCSQQPSFPARPLSVHGQPEQRH